MSAEDKLGGYASGFSSLDANVLAENVTEDYRLLDKNGAIYEKNDLSGYMAELRKIGDKMEITDVMVDGGKAWCKWQTGLGMPSSFHFRGQTSSGNRTHVGTASSCRNGACVYAPMASACWIVCPLRHPCASDVSATSMETN